MLVSRYSPALHPHYQGKLSSTSLANSYSVTAGKRQCQLFFPHVLWASSPAPMPAGQALLCFPDDVQGLSAFLRAAAGKGLGQLYSFHDPGGQLSCLLPVAMGKVEVRASLLCMCMAVEWQGHFSYAHILGLTHPYPCRESQLNCASWVRSGASYAWLSGINRASGGSPAQ